MLVRPFVRALSVGLLGFLCFAIGWPLMLAGPPLLALAAAGAGLSVWRWERTRVVVTTDKLFVVHGTVRRRAAAVRLAGIVTLEIDQNLFGRLFGYGTLIAGDLEIPFVAHPRRVGTLVARLSA